MNGADDRDEKGQDDFEQRMAGVSRLPERDRLVEETVVRARHGGVVRERRASGKRAGKAGSAGRGSRIEIGSVAGLNRRQADALRGGGIAIDARLDLHGFSRRKAAGKVAGFLPRPPSAAYAASSSLPGREGVIRSPGDAIRSPGDAIRSPRPAACCAGNSKGG